MKTFEFSSGLTVYPDAAATVNIIGEIYHDDESWWFNAHGEYSLTSGRHESLSDAEDERKRFTEFVNQAKAEAAKPLDEIREFGLDEKDAFFPLPNGEALALGAARYICTISRPINQSTESQRYPWAIRIETGESGHRYDFESEAEAQKFHTDLKTWIVKVYK